MKILETVPSVVAGLVATYEDLHAHPELGFQEHRTSGIVQQQLTALGFQVLAGIGGTGVVGIFRNGPGATVLVRADMDGLPVHEETGLSYASNDRGVDGEGHDVPLMHACGHDVHVTCLLGAAEVLIRGRTYWSGTLIVLFQPAEELGRGAQAMVNDGLFDSIPRPDIVLGQHVAPAPAGLLGVHAGEAFAGLDSLRVTMSGRGGHGSRPETTVDPIVMAAATVVRLQTIVSREVAPQDSAVVTVGSFHAGSRSNIIPDEAVLELSIRTTSASTRDHLLNAVTRIIRSEAEASGAQQEPEILTLESLPVLVNDTLATRRVMAAFTAEFGVERVIDPGPVSGSEDVGVLSDATGTPLVYWILGGADPDEYAAAFAANRVEQDIPSNHSPRFRTVARPTLDTGVAALVVAATEWLIPAVDASDKLPARREKRH
jgi:amidohydrolase